MRKPTTNNLRPYQAEILTAVLASVFYQKGLTFTVEIARQGGKNELSSQIELLVLMFSMMESKNLIKCSPTFKPQTIVSMNRLKEKLNASTLADQWKIVRSLWKKPVEIFQKP